MNLSLTIRAIVWKLNEWTPNMYVNRTEGVAPAMNNKSGSGGRDTPQHQNPGDHAPDDDVDNDAAVEIKGMAADVTPRVQAALDALSAEIEPLRARLALTEERERQLRDDLAHHPFLPVPGRREFLRELNHVLNHLNDLTILPSIALLHVGNADALRCDHGRDSLDRILVHVAETVSAALLSTDVLGNLGGNDFAIILLGADVGTARTRMQGIVTNLKQTPFTGAGTSMPIDARFGVAEIARGASADAAIRAADRDLIA